MTSSAVYCLAAAPLKTWASTALGIQTHRNPHVPGPQRGPFAGAALPQGRSGDGTSLRFLIRRGSWVARFPGEHSLALGTPGLHDESPVGFGRGKLDVEGSEAVFEYLHLGPGSMRLKQMQCIIVDKPWCLFSACATPSVLLKTSLPLHVGSCLFNLVQTKIKLDN